MHNADVADAANVVLRPAKPINNDALKSKDLPPRLKLLNWGENQTLDGKIVFDDASLKVFYANQAKIGRTKVPIDFNHTSVPGTEAFKAANGVGTIAGYGIPTAVPGDGLYLEYIGWTDKGEKDARDFADLSPTVVTDKDGVVIGLHSAALCTAGSVVGLSFYSAEDLPKLMAKSADEKGKPGEKEENDHDEDDEKGEIDVKAESADAKANDHFSQYGNVKYADKKNHKYPIDTEEHVRAAWSYIHMPKNQTGYSGSEVSKIKKRIAKRAKHFGMELQAHTADGHGALQVNAYATDPYDSMDAHFKDMLEEFRQKLGLDEKAEPDDIMKQIRAKYLGIGGVDNVLPEKTKESSVDPDKRGGPAGEVGNPPAGQPHGVITYSAEQVEKMLGEKIVALEASMKGIVEPLAAKVAAYEAKESAHMKELEKSQRDAIMAEATRAGKVIPLSAEKWATLDLATCKEIAEMAKPSVNMTNRQPVLRALSADGKAPAVQPGARDRAAQSMTEYFNSMGLKREVGYVGVSPRN